MIKNYYNNQNKILYQKMAHDQVGYLDLVEYQNFHFKII